VFSRGVYKVKTKLITGSEGIQQVTTDLLRKITAVEFRLYRCAATKRSKENESIFWLLHKPWNNGITFYHSISFAKMIEHCLLNNWKGVHMRLNVTNCLKVKADQLFLTIALS